MFNCQRIFTCEACTWVARVYGAGQRMQVVISTNPNSGVSFYWVIFTSCFIIIPFDSCFTSCFLFFIFVFLPWVAPFHTLLFFIKSKIVTAVIRTRVPGVRVKRLNVMLLHVLSLGYSTSYLCLFNVLSLTTERLIYDYSTSYLRATQSFISDYAKYYLWATQRLISDYTTS